MPTARVWWHTPAQSSTCPRDDHRAISQDACSLKNTPSFDGYYSLSYALPRMMNLRGFFVNVVQVPHIAEAVTIIVSLVLLLWVAKRGRGIDRRYQFALAVACSVLVSYHLFVYDLSILLIPMMAALGLTGQRNSTVAKIAVLIPLLGAPIGLVSRPFLLAVPLLAFLWSLTHAFDVQTGGGRDCSSM